MAEAREHWRTLLPAMATAVADMDPETRRFMLKTVGALVRGLLPGGTDEEAEAVEKDERGAE